MIWQQRFSGLGFRAGSVTLRAFARSHGLNLSRRCCSAVGDEEHEDDDGDDGDGHDDIDIASSAYHGNHSSNDIECELTLAFNCCQTILWSS